MLQEFTRGKRYGNIWERQSRSHREGNINKIWAVTYRVSTDTMCTITVNEWKVISILHFKDLRKSEGTVLNVEYPWIIHSNQPFQTHSLNNKMPVLKFWKKNNFSNTCIYNANWHWYTFSIWAQFLTGIRKSNICGLVLAVCALQTAVMYVDKNACTIFSNRFRQVQMHGDSKTAGLQNEMKLKSFELERLQMVHEDTLRNLGQAKLDIEKLEKKSEVGGKVHYLAFRRITSTSY